MDAQLVIIMAVIATVMAAGGIFLVTLLISNQRDLNGRLTQIAETNAVSQAELRLTMNERLDRVSKRLGDGLEQSATKTAETLGDLKKHLNVLDDAQKNISELSNQVVGLQEVLANKHVEHLVKFNYATL